LPYNPSTHNDPIYRELVQPGPLGLEGALRATVHRVSRIGGAVVSAGAAVEGVIAAYAVAGVEPVVTVSALVHVAPRAPDHGVFAVPCLEHVVAILARYGVVAS
jgi:hypothetical protein